MWIITILSLVGTIANVYQKRWCFAVWAPANLIWCVYDYRIGAYAQSALMFIYFLLAIFGWFKWHLDVEMVKILKEENEQLREENKCLKTTTGPDIKTNLSGISFTSEKV